MVNIGTPLSVCQSQYFLADSIGAVENMRMVVRVVNIVALTLPLTLKTSIRLEDFIRL